MPTMRSLVPKIIVALSTFITGVGCAYLLSSPHSASAPRPDVPAEVASPNVETAGPRRGPFNSCEGARRRARSRVAADWYRPATHTVSGGNLEGKRMCKPAPVYPQQALDGKVTGIVTVKLLINDAGLVVSARAVKGPGLLQKAAEEAARETVFAPNLLRGEPVNVTGFVTYEFVLR
jgi:TonB family protein